MTYNDLEVNEHALKVCQLADQLKVLMRDNKEMALFMAFSDINRASQEALWRMNDLMYGRGYKPPVELMGG